MGVTMGAGADEKIRQGGQVVSVVRVCRQGVSNGVNNGG